MRKERRSTCIRFGVVSAFGFLFVLVNVQYIRSIRSSNKGAQIPKRGAKIGVGQMLSESNKLRGGKSWISVDTQPFNQDHKADKTHHLILVAGHSVTISGDLQDAGSDEADWFLLDYQKGQGLPQAIIAHIQAGIGEASLDPDSLLVFSGGETRALTGPLTEGSSYFNVADAMDMWPSRYVNTRISECSRYVDSKKLLGTIRPK